MSAQKYILWFSEIDKNDIEKVGGKGANLGEMTSAGLPVPSGCMVTSGAYFSFLEENSLKQPIKQILSQINIEEPFSFNVASEKIKKLILKGIITKEMAQEMMKSY